MKNGVKIDPIIQANNFANDSRKINAITSKQYKEHQSVILENEALFGHISNQHLSSEMILSPEINDILSTTSNNKFAVNKNVSFEPNGKKKKGFSLKITNKPKSEKGKGHIFASKKKNKDATVGINNKNPSDLVQHRKINKMNAINKKILSNQKSKIKSSPEKKTISSSITVKITCPECGNEFSAILNQSKKHITCPHCNYSYLM